MLRLPQRLEAAFHSHLNQKAADLLRRSIYGFMLLYFIVVAPVAILSGHQPGYVSWLWNSVLPIGLGILVAWGFARLGWMKRNVEASLCVGIYLCLCGTFFTSIKLGWTYFGAVARFETVYLLLVAFHFLRMPVRLMVISAMAAYVTGIGMALSGGIQPDWLASLLFYLVPLGLCTISGLMLEYGLRRDFLQTLCHRQEKFQLLHDMAAVSNDTSDVHAMLELSLGRICTNMGWIAGHAILIKPAEGERTAVRYVNREADLRWQQHLDTEPPTTMTSTLLGDVLRSGKPAWNIQSVRFQDMLDSTQVSGLAFPVLVNEEVVAVLEFMSTRHEAPDEHLLALMDQVCAQVARVFERRWQEQELRERALYDPLTGMPNRNYLFDQLRAAISRAKRNPDYRFAILFMDLDRFKWVNDSLGHVKGDRMLIEFSQRLLQEFRPNDMASRLGGDEFAVLLDDIRGEEDVLQAAARIHKHLETPMVLDGHEITAGVSIGIVLSGPQYSEAEELLRDADTAMYMAKHSGRSTHVIFAQHMRDEVVDRLRLVGELRRAIEDGQLALYYQPIVSLETGLVNSFEALVRWPHPTRGMIPPSQFIPLAEETGLIMPLTRWVMAEACRQLGEWQSQQRSGAPVGISINFGARYFADPAMPDDVRHMMEQHNVIPGSLRLEITETQIIENAGLCMENIHRLNEAGVRVYIDDFGTGYSSLNYLASFRVHALKIDRSFMEGLEQGGKEAIVVRAITSLSQHLGLDVIAEGVETPKQLRSLRELGCHYVQGFLFSPAVKVQDAEAMIGRQMLAPHEEQLLLA
ncbi:MAG: sensor-containing diguanylate cyclase/phosphodiesterase [Moraxellaceae bacterium]|nr:sensor-containing diguanylate cyclase/phosphodiesterase [Moraxellaceae bacterium]